MKFIFPQNYRFKNKLFGIIDYSSLILNIIWDIFIYFLVNFIFKSLNVKIFLFIIFCLPILLFSMIGFNHENIIYIFTYVFKYVKKQKLYFYNKNSLCNKK